MNILKLNSIPFQRKMTSKCKFPEQDTEKEKGLLKLSDHWIQILPDGKKIRSRGAGTNGWAINPNSKFNSEDDGYYPYACETGMIETQYDNASTKPYLWETEEKFIGGGDKMIRLNNGTMIKAGGKQGVRFKDGKYILNSEIEQFKCKYCVSTPKVLKILNNSKYTITFCRVTSALEIPQIPTTIKPGEEVFLTTIPSLKDNNWSRVNGVNDRKKGESVWWNGNQNETLGSTLTYFVSRANESDLKPVCQFNKLRPSTLNDSKKGVDYYPYILTIDRNFEVRMNSNNDILMGTDAGYDTYLGNPRFGMRMGTIGSVQYSGNNRSSYSYFLQNDQVKYNCQSFKQGLSSVASTSHEPVVIELFNVKNSNDVKSPKDYCIEQKSKIKKRIKSNDSSPPNIVYVDKNERMASGSKVLLSLLIVILVLILGIVIGFIVYSSMRKSKVDEKMKKRKMIVKEDVFQNPEEEMIHDEPIIDEPLKQTRLFDTDSENMAVDFNNLFNVI